MKRGISLLLLAVLLAVSLPSYILAQEHGEVSVSGQVVNGTGDGGSVAGVTVTLITYTDDAYAGMITTVTDATGAFRFDGLAAANEYLISAAYMEVDYYYTVEFKPGETEAFVEVGVCDTTLSDADIRVLIAHTIISVEETGLLNITESSVFINEGDTTFTGVDGVLFFTIPEGATDINAALELMSDFQILEDNRLTYLVPLPPGERQIVYSYTLPAGNIREIILPLAVNYPVDTYELMISGAGIEIAAAGLSPADPVFAGDGERFIHYRGENLPAGVPVMVHFSGLPGAGGVSPVVFWAIAGVVVIALAGFFVVRRKRGSTNA